MEKIAEVCDVAEADPERFGDLPAMMETKSVNGSCGSCVLCWKRRRQDWDSNDAYNLMVTLARTEVGSTGWR